MSKRWKGGAGLLLALLPLVGCGYYKWDGEGRVVSKDFVPAHWTVRYRTVCRTNYGYHYNWGTGEYEFGPERDCDRVPYDYLEPDTWTLKVEAIEHKEDGDKRHVFTEYVSEHLWNQCKEGQTYSRENGTCKNR